MITTKPLGEPLKEEQLKRLQKLAVAELCDGMALLKIPRCGCMDAAIKSVNKKMTFLGVACTVKAVGGNLTPVQYALEKATAGYCLIVDTDSYTDGPYLGELMALTAQDLGITGIVIDGYIRDSLLIDKMGYPVFCRGYMPRGPQKLQEGEINGPICCAGVKVMPGDVVMGDYDGVAVIPRAQLDAVIDAAEKRHNNDDHRRVRIQEFFDQNEDNAQHKDFKTLNTDAAK